MCPVPPLKERRSGTRSSPGVDAWARTLHPGTFEHVRSTAGHPLVSAVLLVALMRAGVAWACTCVDTHGGWPTGRKGVPRTVHPLVLDARPGAAYALLDIGPPPEQPDALTPVLRPLDAAERWDHDGALTRLPEPRTVVSGRLKHLRNQVPRIFEFIPDRLLPARHRFMLVASPEPHSVIAVFETGDGTKDESEPLERLDLEQFTPPSNDSCAGWWDIVLREVPRRTQPRLLEVLPASPVSGEVPVTLLMSFDGRVSAGRPTACSPWGLRVERTRLRFRVRERRLDGTVGRPVPVALEVPKEAIDPGPPKPR